MKQSKDHQLYTQEAGSKGICKHVPISCFRSGYDTRKKARETGAWEGGKTQSEREEWTTKTSHTNKPILQARKEPCKWPGVKVHTASLEQQDLGY